MNILHKIFKKNTRTAPHVPHVPHGINHFKKKSKTYNQDRQYCKTINVLKKKMKASIYLENFDVQIGSIFISCDSKQKKLYNYVSEVLKRTTVILSTIREFTIYACIYNKGNPVDLIKINKYSTKRILQLALHYNINKRYNSPYSIHSMPYHISIIIKPKKTINNLYINFNHQTLLCKNDDCIICFDKKFLRRICTNNHYMCFSCINLMKTFKNNKCPLCAHDMIVII